MYFHFRSMRISFISKVTRVHKVMTVANNTSLCSIVLVVFLEFIPFDRAEISHIKHTTEFVLVTDHHEPARLPGSYEEALRQPLHFRRQVSSVSCFSRLDMDILIRLKIELCEMLCGLTDCKQNCCRFF